MPSISKEELLETQIGQRSLRDWDKCWEPLASALTESHPMLRHVVGLFRAVLDGNTMYIAKAVERPGGIAKGLRRISGPDQTGNKGYGAQMIRKHRAEITIDILRVENGPAARDVTEALKRAMVKYYEPAWAGPFKRRMEAIRAGRIAAS